MGRAPVGVAENAAAPAAVLSPVAATRLTNLKLLVKVPDLDPATRQACGWEQHGVNLRGEAVTTPMEAIYPYFGQGFVDGDRPRSSAYSDDIVRATVGWAVADAQGNVLAEFPTVKEAEAARKNAKQSVSFELAGAI
jgi:hypothetical protein